MHPINSCQSLGHCWIVKHLDSRLCSIVYVAIDMWLSPLLTSIILVAFSCNLSVVESVVLFPDPELSLTPPDGVRFPSDLFGVLGSLTPNIVDPTRTLVLPSSICKKKMIRTWNKKWHFITVFSFVGNYGVKCNHCYSHYYFFAFTKKINPYINLSYLH